MKEMKDFTPEERAAMEKGNARARARRALWRAAVDPDVSLDQLAEPTVAQLRGMALLAGRTLGVVEAGEIDSLVQLAGRFEPDEVAHEAYGPLYGEFPGLLKVQTPMFRRLQRS
jgi:xylulokinase